MRCNHLANIYRDRVTMRPAVLLITALWYCIDGFAQARAEVHANVRVIPRRFNRLWKRQDDLGYLEQCSILQFWDKQIGRVNVLAFFDSSWQFSHRQATMLRVLRERFEKTGFDNIQFFAINAAPGESRYVDRAEIEVEEETWRQISPSEAQGQPPVLLSSEALIEALGPNIYFIQDTDQLQIWPKLRAFRDQILVIDRCGRLTYQVIVPWSILHFPYVKAAILSTYKDEPCGYCQFQESLFEPATTAKDDPPSSTAEASGNDGTADYGQYSTERTPILVVQTETSRMRSEETTVLADLTESDEWSTTSEEATLSTVSTSFVDNNDTRFTTGRIDASDEQTENYRAQPRSEEQSFTQAGRDESTSGTVATDPIENDDRSTVSVETSTYPISTESNGDNEWADDLAFETGLPNSTYETPVSERQSTENSWSGNNDTEASLLLDRIEYSDTTSTSREDPTTSMPDNFNGTSSEEALTLADQTENFDSSTDEYNSTSLDTSEIESSNATTDEYNEDYFNSTDYRLLTPESLDYPAAETTENLEYDNTTELSTLETDSPTTEVSNPRAAVTEEPRLNSTEIDNLDSRDVLKSRSTNARSVSPNDGSENHLETVETNSEANKEESSLESDYLIPIRIIMRAPHVDEYSDRTMKAHEYLVLKTGQPEYHAHLRSSDANSDEPTAPLLSQSSGPVKRTFGKDESPGLYGEVADYWRNFANGHQPEGAQANHDEDDEEDEEVLEQETNFTEEDFTLTPTTLTSNARENTERPDVDLSITTVEQFDNEKDYDHNSDLNEEVDVVDEEAKSKLIAHYSKLLPWLYYVLAK